MASLANLSREEKVGLGVATAAHVALAVALFVQPESRDAYTPPERMDVSLASEVSLRSTAPDPSAEPAAAIAPELSAEPEPAPVTPREIADAIPEAATPPPRPSVSQPAPRPSPQPTPAPRPTQRAPERPTPTPTPAPQPSRPATASRLGENFLEGTSDASGDRGSPAREVGPAQQASIGQAIIRQLKPHWNPPSGVDVDQLVTVVRFRLNRDGSLSGNPEVLRTTGQTSANRAQVGRHQEQAMRAVRLAAPFNLPEEYYSGWRVITSNFDNRLAQ